MMNEYPLTFVALDLETTGLEPEKDEIIEIGAVKIKNGEISERIDELISIHRPLPMGIRRLTGIQESDLEGKPSIHQILPELERFIGNEPLVIHNSPFDLSFLESKGLEIRNQGFDTLELSRILLPTLKNHKLETLLRHFQIERNKSHRAADDAEGVARLFLCLLKELDELEPETLDIFTRFTISTNWNETDLFQIALRRSLQNALTRKRKSAGAITDLPLPQTNIIGSGILKEKDGITPIDLNEVESFFEEGGIIYSKLESFEARKEQLEMTKTVAQSFNEGQYLVAEAGTGTGKSIAYLIPSIQWATRNGERVIISTNTKNLQDQLFYKDLPFLHQHMDLKFRATLLKGRNNYLCLKRWREILRNPETHLSHEERIEVLPIILWAEETKTGDISENRGFHLARNRGLWAKLTCPEREEKETHRRCFLTKARESAQKSHLVIINHSLLLSDLSADNKILSSFKRLIIDEAHNLEKVSTEHLGVEINFYSLKRILDRLFDSKRRGLLPLFQFRIERERISQESKSPFLQRIEDLKQTLPIAHENGEDLFQRIFSLLSNRKQRYLPGDDFTQKVQEEGQQVLDVLSRLYSGLVSLGEDLGKLKPFQTPMGIEILKDFEEASIDLYHFARSIHLLLFESKEDHCYWTELRDDPFKTELHCVPIDVGPLLADELYKKKESILFTSATLSVASSFEFFLNRNGLSLIDSDRITQFSFGSSFSYDEQARVLIPDYLPSPKSSNFSQRISEIIQKIILDVKKGTLILTTSYELLKYLDKQMVNVLEENGIELLAQGRSGSRRSILDVFKEEKKSCLLGTNSFWEGVDVPGEALELLILTKLPFPVPNEPIIEARCEALEKDGLDSFSNFMVPTAAIRLRQGFGRLIRTRDDIGVVLLLDNRVSQKHYGRFFLNSLPVEPVICNSEEEVMKTLAEFWR
jgi:predicted DnaQ family exonuclease/DinG family helicase